GVPRRQARCDGGGSLAAGLRRAAVGGVGRAGLGDLAVEGVDVLEADISHLRVLAEMRADVVHEHALVISGCGWTLAGQMLSAETLDQVRDGRRLTLLLDLAQ